MSQYEFTWVHPMKLPSCANLREHWATRAKRMSAHRSIGIIKTMQTNLAAGAAPFLVIYLHRYGIRLLDSDNLASAFKGVRDGVAAALGEDDGSDRIEWRYLQDKCKRGEERILCRISLVFQRGLATLAEPATTLASKAKSPAGTATRKRSAKGLKRMEVGK